MPRYKKDVGEIIRYAESRGFELTGMTGSGHWRLRHKNGPILILAATPNGGSRWRKNAIAHINRTHKDTK